MSTSSFNENDRAPRFGASLLTRPNRRYQPARPAVFLDRDGTLLESVHYLSRVEDVRLLPGAAVAVNRFQKSGFACVIVTNQSGIGRGILSENDLARIHEQMCYEFAQFGAQFDAIYFCPVVPSVADRMTVEDTYRKPGPGMLLAAADQLGLDLARSWMIGDTISDVLAGRNAGCRGAILLKSGLPLKPVEAEIAAEFPCTDSVSDAADMILQHESHSEKIST